jgi:predicted nucleotidyltransferase
VGVEIAVPGPVARGEADEDSDVEINLWGVEVPSWAARVE